MQDKMDIEIEISKPDNSHLFGFPLMNHLVLKTIAEYLPPKDILGARSVCQFWHQELTRKIQIKFRNKLDVLEFCLFNNSAFKNENRRLKNYFTKFDFTGWTCSTIYSQFEFELLFKQLAEVATIKVLSLPALPTMEYYEPVFKLISPSVEILHVYTPHTESAISPNINFEVVFDVGDKLILKNIKKLIIETDFTERRPMDSNFYLRLLSCCRNVQEINLLKLDPTDPSIDINLIFNWARNMKIKPHLKLLKFSDFYFTISENIALKMIQLVKEGFIEEIKLEYLSLTNVNISEYFHILAIYYPDKYPEMTKKAKNYSKVQINSINYLHNILNIIPVQNLLFHFPALKKLEIKDEEEEDKNYILALTGQRFPSVSVIHYYSHEMGFLDYSARIFSETFPNLTSLIVNLYDGINFEAIFKNLTMLKILNVSIYSSCDLIKDEDLIGMPDSLIQKLSLEKMDRNALIQLKNGVKFHVKPSILLLKDLEEFTISEMISECRDINENEKRVTRLSFYFGFCLLPKLENLDLHFHSLTHIDEEDWDLFISNCPKLKRLRLHTYLEDKPVFQEIKKIRPNLNFIFR